MALLKLDQVTKQFGGVVALDQVSFQVERGKIVSVIGPNGAGKTTLFNCVTGVIRPQSGTIQFFTASSGEGGEPLERLASHEVARLGVARTFQTIRLFTEMSVLDNVMVATTLRSKTGLKEAVEKSLQILERLELASFAHQLAGSLSYGQQRRLEMARALACGPQLLLLDEPAAGLTYQEKEALMGLLKELKKESFTILLIEHDMRVVMPVSDWVVVLDYGAKIAEGVPKEVQENEKVIEAYLGVKATR